MGKVLLAIIACVVFAIVFNTNNTKSTQQKKHTTTASDIPADVSYTIVSSTSVPKIKRSITVRLNRKVSENTLRHIATKLKNSDPNHYQRTFILYYLPDMSIGKNAAWATTHFRPEMEIKILGLTPEAERKLIDTPDVADADIIGQWLDNTPLIGGKITIYRKDGKIYLKQIFMDDSSRTEELIEQNLTSGRRFDQTTSSPSGDHYLIDLKGDLQIRDNSGLISSCKKIKN